MRSYNERDPPFVDKESEQEEHDGPQKIFQFPTQDRRIDKVDSPFPELSFEQHFEGSSDSGPPPQIGYTMADPPSRDEINARLEAAEARTEARFAQLDVRFANLDNKIDRLVESVARLSDEMSGVKADNRFTRWTIVTVVIASIIAGLAALWATQNNMLSAFQAGLALVQSAPKP